jgi:hypothetical protein
MPDLSHEYFIGFQIPYKNINKITEIITAYRATFYLCGNYSQMPL